MLASVDARADLATADDAKAAPPLLATPLLGPFPSLEAACKQLRGRCDFVPLGKADDPPAPWRDAIVFATTWHEQRGDHGSDDAHVGVRTEAGWFVTREVASGWNDSLRHSTIAANLRWLDVVPGGAAELRVELLVTNRSHDTDRGVESGWLIVGLGRSGRPSATPLIDAVLSRARGYPIGERPYQHAAFEVDFGDGLVRVRAAPDPVGAPVQPALVGTHRLVFP